METIKQTTFKENKMFSRKYLNLVPPWMLVLKEFEMELNPPKTTFILSGNNSKYSKIKHRSLESIKFHLKIVDG